LRIFSNGMFSCILKRQFVDGALMQCAVNKLSASGFSWT